MRRTLVVALVVFVLSTPQQFALSTDIEALYADLVPLLKRTIEMQQDMLMDMLGFPEVAADDNFTVPQYMLDLHRLVSDKLIDESDDANTTTVTQTGAENDVDKATSVDMVHGLTNKDEDEEVDHPKQRLKFHSIPVTSEENVLKAEVRLFRELPSQNGSSQETIVVAHASIYQIGTPSHELKLLDTLDLFNKGINHWAVFDVTDAVKNWITSPEMNLGFEVHTYNVTDNSRVNPSAFGLKKFPRDSVREALMTIFSKGEQVNVTLLSRLKREKLNLLKRATTGDNDLLGQLLLNSKKQLFTKDSLCQLHDFYVDFQTLRWRHSIIAPKGYIANYCSGRCPSTLNNNMNASHHARLQSLMHHDQPDKYPPVACVPVKLSPLIVLYKDDEDKLTLKRYENMMARSCGCQ